MKAKPRPDLNTALHPDDPKIRIEILSLIVQYLEDQCFHASALNLKDEIRLKIANFSARHRQLKKLRGAITSGDWSQIDHITAGLCPKPTLLYSILRHRFFELLAQGDNITALQFLSTRLREHRVDEDVPGDFERLCLLIVDAASPSQSPQLPDVNESRQKIIEAIDEALTDCDVPIIEPTLPNHRLTDLLQQAVTFQFGDYPPNEQLTSLVSDFQPSVIPTGPPIELPIHHQASIKSLTFVPGSNTLLSGSTDKTICVWSSEKKKLIGKLEGHKGRIWALAATENFAASASSDGTVKLWSMSDYSQKAEFVGHSGDIYSVDIERGNRHIVSGGYDQSVIVWDASTQNPETTLKGHSGAVTAVLFDPTGQVVVSGGKDLTIQLWDVRTYLATSQLSPVLGEVTGLDADSTFSQILASTKDNTIRIWDMRMLDRVQVLKGHQNASKHFVRAHFGPGDKTVISGSDDGKIYCWNIETGKVIDKMRAHPMGVFDVVWSSHTHCFASFGDDVNVMLWKPHKI